LLGSLRERYTQSGDQDDLAERIQALEDAVFLTDPGDPNLPVWLSNLAMTLADRYAQ
jgi:hypothetical protein